MGWIVGKIDDIKFALLSPATHLIKAEQGQMATKTGRHIGEGKGKAQHTTATTKATSKVVASHVPPAVVDWYYSRPAARAIYILIKKTTGITEQQSIYATESEKATRSCSTRT